MREGSIPSKSGVERRGSAVRLYVYLARGRRKAVVLRRGPTKLVQLLAWDLSRDTFERGQWFRGRVYERRCDLSPRGDLFVYFAAKHRGPFPTYTAISRPPYFTALALWPGMGTYGGGGLFAADDHVELNHGPLHHALAPGFTLRKGLRVSALGRDAGRGEDDPIQHYRLIRDGWRLVDVGNAEVQGGGASTWIVLDPPRVYAKARPKQPALELEQRLTGIKQTNGPWCVMEHALIHREKGRENGREQVLAGCEWADWDHQGDLLMAREGSLWRATFPRGVMQEPRMLIDLRAERFERVIAPPTATRW